MDVNTSVDNEGRTPLHTAAREGHADVVRHLATEGGAAVNAPNNDGETPLYQAASKGHEVVVRVLATEAGADVNTPDYFGRTPLYVAASEGHEGVVRFLATEAGANVNTPNNAGWTPLHRAAASGNIRMARLLATEAGADVNIMDDDGATAHDLATGAVTSDTALMARLEPAAGPVAPPMPVALVPVGEMAGNPGLGAPITERPQVFISYTQRCGQAMTLALEICIALEKAGYRVWLDFKMLDKSTTAVKNAIIKSNCVIAIITGPCENPEWPDDSRESNAYFNRECSTTGSISELRWAREAGIPIQPVIQASDNRNIVSMLQLAPADLRCLGETEFISLERSDVDYLDVGIRKVIRKVRNAKATPGWLPVEPEPVAPLGICDFFISYTVRNPNAETAATVLYYTLRELGHTVWLSTKIAASDPSSKAAMEQGVRNSRCVLAVITKGPSSESDYFNRPFCLQELRWAVDAGVQIQPVINVEDKQRIGEFLAGAPEDLQFLGGITFFDIHRADAESWKLLVAEVVKAVHPTTVTTGEGAVSGADPIAILTDADIVAICRENGKTWTASQVRRGNAVYREKVRGWLAVTTGNEVNVNDEGIKRGDIVVKSGVTYGPNNSSEVVEYAMVYELDHGGNNPVHARRFLRTGPGGAPWKKDPATKKCPEAVCTLNFSTMAYKSTEDKFISVVDDAELAAEGLNRAVPDVYRNLPDEDRQKLLDLLPKSANEVTANNHLTLLELMSTSGKPLPDIATVKAILATNPDAAKEEDANGSQPLHWAMYNQASAELIQLLLEFHGDATKHAGLGGMLPLHFGMESGAPIASIEALLNADPSAAEHPDKDGMLPLHVGTSLHAFTESVLAVLDAFPEAAAMPSQKDGNLPLHHGMENGALEAVILAVLQANLDAAKQKNSAGHLPLNLGMMCHAPAACIAAVLQANPSAATAPGEGGRWALHVGMMYHASPESIRTLLAANPDAAKHPGEHGKLPLHYGMQNNAPHESILIMLAANPDAATHPDEFSWVPLHYGMKNQAAAASVAAVAIAISDAANRPDKDGKLPLHIGMEHGALFESVAAILAANPDAAKYPDEHGRLPLHHGMKNKASAACIMAVLAANADAANQLDSDGKLPLELGIEHGASADVLELLRSHLTGATIEPTDQKLVESVTSAEDAAATVPADSVARLEQRDAVLAVPLPPGKRHHFFICHHQGSGGDQCSVLCRDLKARGFKVWYNNDQTADQRNLQGMRCGVQESECLLLFLSGRKETAGQPDLNGQYEGPFTRWFCHEEMHAAGEHGLRVIGVAETDDRKGKPNFAQERAHALTGKSGGGPVNEHAGTNVHLLEDVRFIPFRRQWHEREGMLDEIVRQRPGAEACADQLAQKAKIAADKAHAAALRKAAWIKNKEEEKAARAVAREEARQTRMAEPGYDPDEDEDEDEDEEDEEEYEEEEDEDEEELAAKQAPAVPLPPGKATHFFFCHHEGSGGDQARLLCDALRLGGFTVWHDTEQTADQRNFDRVRRGIEASECLLVFLSGRKETGRQPDPDGQYESPFTLPLCHEVMHAAHVHGLTVVGVMESEKQKGEPDFALEMERVLTSKHDHAATNAHLLSDVCFIPFRREPHEWRAMLAEVARQRDVNPPLTTPDTDLGNTPFHELTAIGKLTTPFHELTAIGKLTIETMRCRVFFTGEGRNGKTSTRKALTGKAFDPDEVSTRGTEQEGIELLKVKRTEARDWNPELPCSVHHKRAMASLIAGVSVVAAGSVHRLGMLRRNLFGSRACVLYRRLLTL